MDASNTGSMTSQSWGSYYSNGASASRGLPSQADPTLDAAYGQGGQQGDGIWLNGHGQQPAAQPDRQSLCASCRHPLGSERCLSHSPGNAGSPPGTGRRGPRSSRANRSASASTRRREFRSSPPAALETYIQDTQAHEQLAYGIPSRGLAVDHEANSDYHQGLVDIAMSPAPLGTATYVNTGVATHNDHESIWGVGAWCPPPS